MAESENPKNRKLLSILKKKNEGKKESESVNKKRKISSASKRSGSKEKTEELDCEELPSTAKEESKESTKEQNAKEMTEPDGKRKKRRRLPFKKLRKAKKKSDPNEPHTADTGNSISESVSYGSANSFCEVETEKDRNDGEKESAEVQQDQAKEESERVLCEGKPPLSDVLNVQTKCWLPDSVDQSVNEENDYSETKKEEKAEEREGSANKQRCGLPQQAPTPVVVLPVKEPTEILGIQSSKVKKSVQFQEKSGENSASPSEGFKAKEASRMQAQIKETKSKAGYEEITKFFLGGLICSMVEVLLNQKEKLPEVSVSKSRELVVYAVDRSLSQVANAMNSLLAQLGKAPKDVLFYILSALMKKYPQCFKIKKRKSNKQKATKLEIPADTVK